MEKTGITVAGSMVADLYYEIDTYPRQGMLTNVRATHSGVGGTGNLILDLARLDPALPVRVSALAGLDAGGDMMAAALSRFPNIDLRGLVRAGVSSVDHVMEPRDTKQRTFFYQAGANDVYDMTCIDWAAADAKIFHLEYLLLMARVDAADPEFGTHGARILHEARTRGMQTSVDVVSERSERSARVVSAALRYTDYCTINEYEAETVTGIDVTDTASAQKALQALRDLGVARWAVIHSPAMGWGLDCRSGEFAECPSLHLPEGFIRGTTGAGDAYCAGILYGAYHGLPLPRALQFAAATAACSLSGVNGTDAVPEAAGVWEVYERYCERGEAT